MALTDLFARNLPRYRRELSLLLPFNALFAPEPPFIGWRRYISSLLSRGSIR